MSLATVATHNVTCPRCKAKPHIPCRSQHDLVLQAKVLKQHGGAHSERRHALVAVFLAAPSRPDWHTALDGPDAYQFNRLCWRMEVEGLVTLTDNRFVLTDAGRALLP